MVERKRGKLVTENEQDGSLAFMMVKGDLSRKVFQNDPSVVPESTIAQDKVLFWLNTTFSEYAEEVCGVHLSVERALLISGLSKEQLVNLYGVEHGNWMDRNLLQDQVLGALKKPKKCLITAQNTRSCRKLRL